MTAGDGSSQHPVLSKRGRLSLLYPYLVYQVVTGRRIDCVRNENRYSIEASLFPTAARGSTPLLVFMPDGSWTWGHKVHDTMIAPGHRFHRFTTLAAAVPSTALYSYAGRDACFTLRAEQARYPVRCR